MQAEYAPAPFAVSGATPIEAAAGWLGALATGSLALGLCIIAIAVIGLLMLSGRLPVRSGMRVVLGCFVLLGAPVIAAALMGLAGRSNQAPSLTVPQEAAPTRAPLPKANYDPYAGASLRQD